MVSIVLVHVYKLTPLKGFFLMYLEVHLHNVKSYEAL